jgi:hypothetical protein
VWEPGLRVITRSATDEAQRDVGDRGGACPSTAVSAPVPPRPHARPRVMTPLAWPLATRNGSEWQSYVHVARCYVFSYFIFVSACSYYAEFLVFCADVPEAAPGQRWISMECEKKRVEREGMRGPGPQRWTPFGGGERACGEYGTGGNNWVQWFRPAVQQPLGSGVDLKLWFC